MNDITNRVANSPIYSLNMEEFYPQERRVKFDLRPFLYQDLILKEKEFRSMLKEVDWSVYKDTWVSIICSVDAIVPTWAYMLVSTYLQPVSKGYVIGGPEELEIFIAEQTLKSLDLSVMENRPVVIKGCSKIDIPLFAYGRLVSLLQPIAKSLMFGEPCSTVPLVKKGKS